MTDIDFPDLLLKEERWSAYTPKSHNEDIKWTSARDNILIDFVRRSSKDKNRFPSGIHWLNASEAIGFPPIECVKRYAYLHEAFHGQIFHTQDAEPDVLQISDRIITSDISDIQYASSARFSSNNSSLFSSKLSDEDFAGHAHPHQSILDTASPIASPRINSFNFEDLALNSPASPPFAVRHGLKGDEERERRIALNKSMIADVPELCLPRHLVNQAKPLSKPVAHCYSPRQRSTTAHTGGSILEHAFKSASVGKDLNVLHIEGQKNPMALNQTLQQCENGERDGLASASDQALLDRDASFTGSMTLSALEDAFLDMAGSRLDASSVLLSSRIVRSPTHRDGNAAISKDHC